MTSERRLATQLPSIIGEIARGPYPDYIDDVLAGTARRRQRPRWTFPERWLPMDIAVQPLQGGRRVPWRPLALLALLVVALAGAVLLAGGRPRVAPPFGRAANGLVAYASGGDIKAVDVVTRKKMTLIAGPEDDSAPVYSADGARFAFGRSAAGDRFDLLVARSDGTGLVKLTPTPLLDLGHWSFSPDGRSVVAVATVGGRSQLLIVPSDGSAAPRFFDVGPGWDWWSPRYRPDGSEILFVGTPNRATFSGLHAVDPATGVVRTIVEGSSATEVSGAAWSPDGSQVAYGVHDARRPDTSAWVHVVAADGTGDMRLAAPADVLSIDGLAWSNDATRLVVVEATDSDGQHTRSVVVPVDGDGRRVELDCAHGGYDCSGNFRVWSPDDSTLIGSLNEGEAHYLADPVTGRILASSWGGQGEPTWQRLAP
jgi:Tol biopolymer transport system component